MDLIRLSTLIFAVVYILIIPIFFRLKDEEDENMSLGMSLFLMAVLALVVTAPLVAIIIIGYLFMDIISLTQIIQFSSHWDAVIYVITMLITLTFGELIIVPITKALLVLTIQHPIPRWIGYLLTMLINTVLIYIISELVPGVTIQGIKVALCLALLYQCIEWIVEIRNANQAKKKR